jgi:ribosomal protein S18 acetylase RimI-like enzyme
MAAFAFEWDGVGAREQPSCQPSASGLPLSLDADRAKQNEYKILDKFMMQFSIRSILQDDILFLWDMLYYAAHMSEDGLTTSDSAKHDPQLTMYVQEWGRHGDFGFIAYDSQNLRRLGAAWLRLLTNDTSNYGYYDDETPELAIAVLPEFVGQGIGSALLSSLIDKAKSEVPGIVLTVRSNNQAKHLYERKGFIVIDEIVNRVGTKSSKMLLKF